MECFHLTKKWYRRTSPMIIPLFIRPSSILPLISPLLCCGANVYNKCESHKDRPCLTQTSRPLIASSWPAMFTNHSWRFFGPSSVKAVQNSCSNSERKRFQIVALQGLTLIPTRAWENGLGEHIDTHSRTVWSLAKIQKFVTRRF